mmetsp:Transcript_54219/g.109056  ORF Transcript_54219/g.109056 Transcript_54219/m.109056 type:complete len:252 (-) Transcript_54219:23-778(-)
MQTLNFCALLTADEEDRVLGFKVCIRPRGNCDAGHGCLDVSFVSQATALILAAEAALRIILRDVPPVQEEFPRNLASTFSKKQLAVSTLDELQESWNVDQSLNSVELTRSTIAIGTLIVEHLTLISRERAKLELDLLQSLNNVPAGVAWTAPSFRMRRAANAVPFATLRDLAKCAVESADFALKFNPYLSDTSINNVRECVLDWLKLCAFEDKLKRIQEYGRSNLKHELQRELQELGRCWSPEKYPEWLFF